MFFVDVLWYNACMLRRPYFLTAILSLILLGIHWYADTNSLYFTYKWLDIPMHLFGGFVVALLGVCLLSFLHKKIEKSIFFILVVLFVLVVGLSWEVFELFMNIVYHIRTIDLANIYDTIFDLINDVIGAVVVLYFAYKKQWYE